MDKATTLKAKEIIFSQIKTYSPAIQILIDGDLVEVNANPAG